MSVSGASPYKVGVTMTVDSVHTVVKIPSNTRNDEERYGRVIKSLLAAFIEVCVLGEAVNHFKRYLTALRKALLIRLLNLYGVWHVLSTVVINLFRQLAKGAIKYTVGIINSIHYHFTVKNKEIRKIFVFGSKHAMPFGWCQILYFYLILKTTYWFYFSCCTFLHNHNNIIAQSRTVVE